MFPFDSFTDMGILLFNGFLLLGFVVATVPDVLVLGSPGHGAMQIMDRDPHVKKCRYGRPFALLEARCSNLELHEIPLNLKADIQVRCSRISQRKYTKLSTFAFILNYDEKIDTQGVS